PIMVTYYEATVTGEYTDMEIVKGPDAYSLLYQGYVNGVVFWPSDVLGASAPPTLGGDPILAGYDFTGWTPGQLDWSTASATVSNQVITPAQGIPYILQTTTYTITVTANFTSTGEPEYPLGSPQTGAFDWSGIAGALAVLSSLGVALVARKKEK
ncbi:MAG TPA: hypothetical protein VN540_01085, partial [Clostridia bacterium]|nr:hypothetical protein [Clostridia bacterium]